MFDTRFNEVRYAEMKKYFPDLLKYFEKKVEGGISMAYDDIYKGLSDEDRGRMLRQDIPKFVSTGETHELTEEEKREAHETLLKFIRLGKRAEREKRVIPLTDEELNRED